jgi:DNA processing protein
MQPDIKYWVALNEFQKFGPIRFKKLLNFFPDCLTIWQASSEELIKAGIEENLAQEFVIWREGINPEEKWENLEKENIQVVTIKDNEYPTLLKEIYDPPPLLYFKGHLPKNEFNLGVVGTRKMSLYGQQVVEKIVRPLAKAGLTIVSGLALGIDASAHRAAIEENGETVAILGSGLAEEVIYPSTHRQLAKEIIEHGCLISEFPLHMAPLQHHFPFRNRLISGLSLGVLVIEATEDSGSLITAHHALEQNRELFAVPGDIFKETSIGPNRLIKMGAQAVTSAEDILEALNLRKLKTHLETREFLPTNPTEEKILAHLSKTPLHIDELVAATGLETSLVSSTLTLMEMKGMVRHLGGMHYVIAH